MKSSSSYLRVSSKSLFFNILEVVNSQLLSKFFKNYSPLLLILCGYSVFAMSRFSLGMILVDLQSILGINSFEAGILFSSTSAAMAFTVILAGKLNDKFGTYRMYLAGIAIFSLGHLLTYFTNDYFLLIFYLLLVGAGSGIISSCTYLELGRYPSSRASMLGVSNLVYSIGGFFGSWFTGIMMSTYNWQLAFSSFSVFSAISGLLYYFSNSSSTSNMSSNYIDESSDSSHYFSKFNVVLLYTTMFVSNLAFFVLLAWVPTLLVSDKGLDLYTAGFIFSFFSLAGGIFSIPFGYLSDKLKNRTIVASFTAFISAILGYFFLSITGIYESVLLLSLLGAFLYPYWNLQLAMGQESVSPKKIGMITGLLQNSAYLSGIAGPLITGYFIKNLGIITSFNLGVIAPLVLYGFLILFWKAPKRILR